MRKIAITLERWAALTLVLVALWLAIAHYPDFRTGLANIGSDLSRLFGGR